MTVDVEWRKEVDVKWLKKVNVKKSECEEKHLRQGRQLPNTEIIQTLSL